MNARENVAETGRSTLSGKSIVGFFFLILAIKDLLAWAELTSPESGWLARVTGADWAQPFAGLALVLIGVLWAGPAITQCFSLRDEFRKQARRNALIAAFVCAAAAVYTLDTLVPSKELLFSRNGLRLSREARRAGLAGLLLSACGFTGFILMRRRDVGFWKVTLPVIRNNDIWNMAIKAEVALRAIDKNDEAYRLLEDRTDFIQAEIGGKFDLLCRHLAKESADLATIDSTARLQMDVGHIFKRYADFHVRLVETRHRIADEIRELTSKTVTETLEQRLPGHKLVPGQDLTLSVSYPVLHDADGLKKRREEWDETMRGVVSIGAAKGNQIIGEWIDRAARGEVTADEMPAAMEVFRSLCPPSADKGPFLSIASGK